jgi:phage terminase large subunit
MSLERTLALLQRPLPGATLEAWRHSPAYVRALLGPLGGGAATACRLEVLRLGLRSGVRTRWAIVAPSLDRLNAAVLAGWRALIPEDTGDWDPRERREVLPVMAGGREVGALELWFFAVDQHRDRQRIGRAELTGAWISHARELGDRGVLEDLVDAAGQVPTPLELARAFGAGAQAPRGGVLVSGRAPVETHWLRDVFELEQREGYALFKQPGGRAPAAENLQHLPQGFYQGLLDKPAEWVRVNVDNAYGSAGADDVDEALRELAARCAGDALRFACEELDVLPFDHPDVEGEGEPDGPVRLESWQQEGLWAASTNGRLSIRAGHGVGKTAFEAVLGLWFVLTHHDVKIPVTSNTEDQLLDTIMPEIKKWARRLRPALRSALELDNARRIYLRAQPEMRFLVARVARKERPEALQGFHATNLLFLIDEASGIPEEVFEVALGALSSEGAKVVMCANPTRLSGFFYDSHHKNRARWYTMRVNCEDVPRARGHIEDIISSYGQDSNAYRVRVQGEFPTEESDVVISLQLLEAAAKRQVVVNETIKPIWGVDVAWTGDRSALAKRCDKVQLEPVKSWQGKNPMQLAGLIKREYDDTPDDDLPAEIVVDVIGMGAGVYARLHELGLPARACNVAEAAASSDRFLRQRDELWWMAREWLEGLDCQMCDDKDLQAELIAPTYEFTSAGKTVVEPKSETRKRLRRSPDLADAWILTFAGGTHRRRRDRDDRYKGARRRLRSWLTQ